MFRWLIAVLRGMEIVSKTFRDDRHQAKFQKGSPTEGPEEEFLGALNGKRNGIYSRDGAHTGPFRGDAKRTTRLRNLDGYGSTGEIAATSPDGAATPNLFASFHRSIDRVDALHRVGEAEAFS